MVNRINHSTNPPCHCEWSEAIYTILPWDCGACSECKQGIPLRVCFGYASQPLCSSQWHNAAIFAEHYKKRASTTRKLSQTYTIQFS